MNVSLTPELEKLVAEKVKTGMYQTSSEVVREGLRLLKERDDRLAALRKDVIAGFDALDRGEFENYRGLSGRTIAERVKAQARKRLLAKAK